MEIIQVKDYEEMSKTACFYLLKKVGNIEQPVLGLATGSTPEGLYRQLIEAYKNGSLSFKNVKTFNLDEYIHLDQTNPNSYYYYMKKHLFDWIDIPKEQIHLPNGKAQDLETEF